MFCKYNVVIEHMRCNTDHMFSQYDKQTYMTNGLFNLHYGYGLSPLQTPYI